MADAQTLSGGISIGGPTAQNASITTFSSLKLTVGSGATDAQRVDNCTKLQTAANLAPMLVDDLGGAVVEYNCATVINGNNAGLNFPATSRGIQGTGNKENGTRLVQFAVNHPIISFGDLSANTQIYGGGNYTGLRLSYGVSQTGQTQARGLLNGRLTQAFIDQITVTPYTPSGAGPFHPFEGWRIGISGSTAWYDNVVGRVEVEGGQNWLVNVQASGTGNVIQQLHAGAGGVGNRIALSGGGVNIYPGSNEFGTINQLNVEWTSSNQVLYVKNAAAVNILHGHFEGNSLTGFNPRFIYTEVGNIRFLSLRILNSWVVGANASGTARLIAGYLFGKIKIDSLSMVWDGAAEHVQTLPINLVEFDTGVVRPIIEIGRGVISGNGAAVNFDPTLPASTYGQATDFGLYRYRPGRSTTQEAAFTQGDANLTIYAAHRDPTINQSVAQTADRTLTLTNKSGATGFGATTGSGAGSVVTVIRSNQSGAAGQLLVKDEAGATIDTWAAAATGTRTYMLTGTSVALN